MRTLLCILALCILVCLAHEGNVHEEHADHVRPTDHWAVELHPGSDADALAADHGYINMGRVGSLPNVYLFHKNTRVRSEDLASSKPIHEHPLVSWAENQVARKKFKRFEEPKDPLFGKQWHHKVVNVFPVWADGITGLNITISIVDDGMQSEHPDISAKYVPEGSWDFNENDAIPAPHKGDDHGTSAGGVAAAGANTVCGVGTAPNAMLSAVRLISEHTTDVQEANGLSFRSDINYIYSNSWGPNDDGRRLEGPGKLTLRAMEDVVTNGRNGLGGIYVWAGGNGRNSGDNCNYDGYANSRFTLTIGSMDANGKQAYYSESCASLIAVAPSSGKGTQAITTTDLLGNAGTSPTECTSTFGGTSAAAPLVAGIVALVLEANPLLGWRDVQHVFINTSKIIAADDTDWVTNGAGLHHSHKFGFGLVDAAAAVAFAKAHKNFPPTKLINSTVMAVGKPLLDFAPVDSTIQINEKIIVETVEVTVNALHQYRGNLIISLKSPSGTVSILQEKHNDKKKDIHWTYTTVRSWGENSQGEWTLRIDDQTAGNTGTFEDWQLNIYGH